MEMDFAHFDSIHHGDDYPRVSDDGVPEILLRAPSATADTADILSLVAQGLTRRQIARRLGARVTLARVDKLLQAVGVDPQTVPVWPVDAVLRLLGQGASTTDTAARLGLTNDDVQQVRAAAGRRRGDTDSVVQRFVSALLVGGHSFQDDPAAINGPNAGRRVVISRRSTAHSGASSSLSLFNNL